MYSSCVGVTQVPLAPTRSRAVGLRLLSDDRLGRMVADGNESAFEVISERYQGPLYRHCRAILNHHEDASDALQNTLLNAYRALSSKPRDLALRPWLYRIAHNESISLLRRRRPHAELDEAAEVSRPGADHDAETNARLAQLVGDLGQLSERQRGALVMREITGLAYSEIAATFAISENAAKQTVHEAHSALHELEEGRSMDCEAVRGTLSVGDRRLLRGRKVRAHLRGCDGCTSFHDSIHARRRDLAALAPPIPAALGVALLHSLFGGGGGAGGAGGGGSAIGGGGLLGGGTATAGATATAATATTAGGGLAVTTGATAGAAATAGGAGGATAGGGLLAALTGATGPALAGAGVVKSLLPAAVGLTMGAGALGIAAPEPVTRAITEVERAFEPRQPIQAPRAPATAPMATSGQGASMPSQAPGLLMQAPLLVTPFPLPEAQRPGADAVAPGSPLAHAAPPADAPTGAPFGAQQSPASPSETPTTAVDAPAAAPPSSDLKPEADQQSTPSPSPGEGTRFESITPTEAPPSATVPDAPVANEPVAPAPLVAPAAPLDPAPFVAPPAVAPASPAASASSAPVPAADPVATEPSSTEIVPSP